MSVEHAADLVSRAIDQREQEFIGVSDAIWDCAEGGFQEFRSADLLCKALEGYGFTVTRGLARIPTAFKGVWGSGGPVAGFLGEFDALPGLSQQAGCTCKRPVEPGAYGHGCGHNLLGAGALAAAVALKEYLEQTGKPGTVVYFGTPAEEGGGGKTFMARDGEFEGVDFVYTWHPGSINQMRANHMAATLSKVYEFKGVSAHAGAAPQLGRSALDSCELMNVGANYLREHVSGEVRMHYAYLDAGGPAPNIVQDHAAVKYIVRAPYISQVVEAFARIDRIAEGAAMMSGTTVTSRTGGAYSEFTQNVVLASVLDEALHEIGAPAWDEADFALAREFADSLSESEKAAGRAMIQARYGAQAVEEKLARPLDTIVGEYTPDKVINVFGATDVGDVGFVVPTAKLNVATNALGTQLHTWQMTAQGKSPIGRKGMLVAGKVMALAAVRVMERGDILAAAREEFLGKNGGVYDCPLPKDAVPPEAI